MSRELIQDPFFQELNLLYRSAFDREPFFKPFVTNTKPNYPLDVWVNDEFCGLEIPIINGKSEDITVTREGDLLRIKYVRSNRNESERKYISRGIINRDFDFTFKLTSKFDRNGITSTFENGLLSVFLPFAAESKPETISVIDVAKNWKKVAEGEPLVVD